MHVSVLTRDARVEVQSSLRVEIRLTIRKKLEFGQRLLVTGNLPELGNWTLPLALLPEPGNTLHTINLSLPRDCHVCFSLLFDRGRCTHLAGSLSTNTFYRATRWPFGRKARIVKFT